MEFSDHVLRPSGEFAPAFRAGAAERLGEDGAWLLLSLAWYGWRVHFDLATALVAADHPKVGTDGRPSPIGPEFDIVRDLQVQAHLFAVAEQYSTLLRAARVRVEEERDFFTSYMDAPSQFADLIEEVSDLSENTVHAIVGDPHGVPPSRSQAELDPALVHTREVNGLLIPESVIEDNAHRSLVDTADEVVRLIRANADELDQLTAVPVLQVEDSPEPRPLREIDNAFRHGLRLMFHQCVPTERNFREVGGTLAASPYAVDLYMPVRRGPDKIRFGTVVGDRERTTGHLQTIKQLSIRTGQLARGFIGNQVLGDAQLLLASVHLDPEVDHRTQSTSGDAIDDLGSRSEEQPDSPRRG